MEFDTTRPPNFITIANQPHDIRVDLGVLSEAEFIEWADKMREDLRLHWLKRKKQCELTSSKGE